MDVPAQKKEYGSALNKALTVLELIATQPQAIGLPDLTARLGVPRQTLHRTLAQLEGEGLIIRDPTRDRFSVGPRLSQLARAALFSENHQQPTRAILQALVDEIGESCNIGVLDGLHFVYLDRIQTDKPLRIHLEAGSHVPAYCTSGGKILLAHLDAEQRTRLLQAVKLRSYTQRTITDPDQLEVVLANAMRDGVATNDEEFTAGIVGIATPILDESGRAIAAVACHAPRARLSLTELQAHTGTLRAAADDLSRYWG